MNNKHKEAFQELRQWCEKWDANIIGDVDDTVAIALDGWGANERVYYFDEFNKMMKRASTYIGDDNKVYINFMEQENDNTEE